MVCKIQSGHKRELIPRPKRFKASKKGAAGSGWMPVLWIFLDAGTNKLLGAFF
jgi:hypothetical protein